MLEVLVFSPLREVCQFTLPLCKDQGLPQYTISDTERSDYP